LPSAAFRSSWARRGHYALFGVEPCLTCRGRRRTELRLQRLVSAIIPPRKNVVVAITTPTAPRKTSSLTSPDVSESVAILPEPRVLGPPACDWTLKIIL
jgi:hypothetical protein